MGQLIEVPGQGQVEFPDGMTDDQIVDAIKRNPAPGSIAHSVQALHPQGAAMAVNRAPPVAAAKPDDLAPFNEPTHAGDMPPPDAPGTLPWSDLPGNIVPSAKVFAGNIYHAVTNPKESGKAVINTLAGLPDLLPKPYETAQRTADLAARTSPERAAAREESKTAANAFAGQVGERYGSPLKARNTLIGDPIGFAADASMVTPLAAATAPERVAATVGRVGRAVDPIVGPVTAVAKGAKLVEPAVSEALGATTGAGSDSVRAAARAGAEGGENAEAFKANMRGAPTQEIVDKAKSAISQLRQERSEAYKAGKIDLAEDNTPIKFAPIEDAVNKASEVGTFKGVTVEPAAVATIDKMRNIVEEWSYLDPAEYHTPVGIDALKRSLGNIRDSTKPHTPENVAANRLYNAVRDELTTVAPKYSGMMKDYAKASDKLKEATGTFSLGDRASGDTSSRKLLSAMRNNVQTNYGERGRILDQLAEKEPTLPYAIAGQGFNSLAPRGVLGRVSLPLMAAGVATHPAALPLLAASSPRLVGEGAFLAGRSAAGTRKAANTLHINGDTVRAVEQGTERAGASDQHQSPGAMALAFRRALERRNALARK